MPKTENTKEEKKVVEKTLTDREKRWEAFLAGYAVKNPVKFASKKANGEFDNIPVTFK